MKEQCIDYVQVQGENSLYLKIPKEHNLIWNLLPIDLGFPFMDVYIQGIRSIFVQFLNFSI